MSRMMFIHQMKVAFKKKINGTCSPLCFLLICSVTSSSAIYTSSVMAKSNAPRVEVQETEIRPIIKKVELSGTVTSPRVSQISTSVEGLVKDILFDSGATVKEGELLLTLDPEIEQAALAQSEARVAQSFAELTDAKRRLAIAKNLAKRAHGTKNEVDARLTEIEIDKATLAGSKAQQARMAAILKRYKLKAPFTGVISKKMAEVGQWVTPGTAVFELVEMQGLRIDIPVPQQYYGHLQKGATISLQFEALSTHQIAAEINAIIPISDPDARTFTLRVRPKDNELAITPGMSARATIRFDTGKKNVVVNRDALIRYPDGRVIVWVLENDGDQIRVKERKIEIGLAFDQFVQVLSGLQAGDQVVTHGNEALRDGQVVRRDG